MTRTPRCWPMRFNWKRETPHPISILRTVNMVCGGSPIKESFFHERTAAVSPYRPEQSERNGLKKQLSVSVKDYYGKQIMKKKKNWGCLRGKKVLSSHRRESSKKGFFMIRCALTTGRNAFKPNGFYCVITAPVRGIRQAFPFR